MVLTEIFSTSSLFSIAIVIILGGCMFVYFNQKNAALNHKISSMMGLVTTMAEEMQYFRSKLTGGSKVQEPVADQIHIVEQFLGGNKDSLIEVSDEEDDDSEEDDSESDSEDDSSESDEESDSESDEEEEDDSDEEEDSKVKSINIDLGDNIDLDIGDELDDAITITETNNIKTINLTEDISSFDITSKTLENINDIDISIKLTNDYSEKEKHDYKKLSLNKLRDVVVEKGIVIDASKLKKNDILKMLGEEQ
jgi:hypothetical protein